VSAPASAPPRPSGEEDGTVLTPTFGRSVRRALFWVLAIVVALVIAVGAVLVNAGAPAGDRLDPESAAPDGTRAVAEVLRDEGVDVTVTDSLDATRSALEEGAAPTLAVHDPAWLLDDDRRARLRDLVTDAAELVLLEPGFELLEDLAPGVSAAGSPGDEPLDAECSFLPARLAGTVTAGFDSYRVTGAEDAVACLPDGDGYSLVRLEREVPVTVLGATTALTNERVLEQGNAALALALLGPRDRLVWYVPSAADLAADGESVPAPGWVVPVMLLLILTTVAAGVWRGRRFGPLIVENLPVVVRASETMEGRARLYQRSSARLRALDALRVGAVSRLAKRVGMPSSASVQQVSDAVAAVLGTDVRGIRSLLLDADPATDAELVRLSDGLLELERAVDRAVRP